MFSSPIVHEPDIGRQALLQSFSFFLDGWNYLWYCSSQRSIYHLEGTVDAAKYFFSSQSRVIENPEKCKGEIEVWIGRADGTEIEKSSFPSFAL